MGVLLCYSNLVCVKNKWLIAYYETINHICGLRIGAVITVLRLEAYGSRKTNWR